MIFNTIVLVGALVIGGISAVVALAASKTRSEWGALGYGLLTGVGLSGLAAGVVVGYAGRDVFAVVHLAYLVVTVAVPLAALVTMVRGTFSSAWVRALLGVLILPAPIGLYATHIEPFWLRVDHVVVPVASAGDLDLRVGVLSDLQTVSIGDYELDAVATLLARDPDIVLVPGDLWQMSPSEFSQRAGEFAEILQMICDQVEHVFIVRGNTDRVDGLREVARGTNAVVLDNEVVDVVVEGHPVRIFGISFDGDRDRFEQASELFAAPASDEPIRIVLAHQPDELYRFASGTPIDLMVAGHTHGGQVAVPFVGPPVTLSSVPRDVAAGGLHRLDGSLIYVSTGVGRERGRAPQVRFGVRPTIGILDLFGE
jgi:predicted MPP superfamily phosphohydrolase